jgi:HK97 family phage portal protein
MPNIIVRAFSALRKSFTLSDPISPFLSLGTYGTATGKSVNANTAMEVTAVLRCAMVIADGVATVPLRLFRKNEASGARRAAVDHPAYDLLAYQPNEWQDSIEFRTMLALHVVLTGNAYAYKTFVGDRITELLPIMPNRMKVEQQADTSLVYTYTPLGSAPVVLPADRVMHIRGPSWNGYSGFEFIRLARDAIGLSMALEESHARLHRNGVSPSGAWSVEGTLTLDQHNKLRDMLTKELAGTMNVGTPLILDRGARWLPLSMSGVDAQHLETRKYQVEEICRAFGVMPIMVGHADKTATYASAEQMFLAHAVHTIRPWHRRFEAAFMRSLITPQERAQGYYVKFIDGELMRGAAKDRSAFYQSGISAGWLTRNEAREWEELDPIDGLSDPLAPLNMAAPGEQSTSAEKS